MNRRFPWTKWPRRRRVGALAGTIAVTAGLLGGAIGPRSASADPSWIGGAGTDTALPDQNSHATYSWLATHQTAIPNAGQSPFANLQVSVNQTTDLTNQAVSITWKGAPSTGAPSQTGQDWLQIFQCWGDPDVTNPDNPGPPPEQCEFGGQPFGLDEAKHVPNQKVSFAYTRIMASPAWSTFAKDKSQGFVDTDPSLGFLWRPFRAVNGKVISSQWQTAPAPSGGLFDQWNNDIFDRTTTNEDAFGLNSPTGTGSELFQVDTGLEAPALGCGQQVLTQPDGSQTVPKCWLVVVPRSTPTNENPPEIPASIGSVLTSPLTPETWPNRIAIPLQFKPVGSSCPLGADQRRIAGGEMAVGAVANWAPTLCTTPGLPPYSYASVGDTQGRSQILNGGYGAAGMAVVSRPIDPATVDSSNPIVYAPLTLSGLTIGFNIERDSQLQTGSPKPRSKADDDAEKLLEGERIASIRLTPRLVAKLLTASYLAAFPDFSREKPTGYDWVKANPDDLTHDPDFIQFNPEFNLLYAGFNPRHLSALLTEQPPADATYQLWRWLLADPEASAWLAGNPDPWGMKVNPVYNTSATLNSSGVPFANPVPDTFPENDQYCSHQNATVSTPPQVVPLCMLDAHPYAPTMRTAAQETRAANDGARATPDVDQTDDNSHHAATLFRPDGPDTAGLRSMISVTDSASAAQYGLQTASLSQAGDDAPPGARTFIDANPTTILSGEQAMAAGVDPSFRETNPTTRATGAYPLALLSYAVVAPRGLDQAARNDYAAFISYGVTKGQVPGIQFGQLPPGYAPLPADLQAQALAAADQIRSGVPAPPDNSGAGGGEGTAGGSAGGAGGTGAGAGVAGAGGTGAGGNGAGAGANGLSSRGSSARPPSVAIRRASARTRTPFEKVGAIRFVLLIAFLVGVAAVLGSRLLRVRRRANGSASEAPGGALVLLSEDEQPVTT